MTDLHPCPTEPDLPTGRPALHDRGYTIQLRQTPPEWMAAITQPNQRPAIVLAADREAVLVKAREWIAAHSSSPEAGSACIG